MAQQAVSDAGTQAAGAEGPAADTQLIRSAWGAAAIHAGPAATAEARNQTGSTQQERLREVH